MMWEGVVCGREAVNNHMASIPASYFGVKGQRGARGPVCLTCSSTLPLYTLMGYMVPKVMRAMATADAVSTALKLLSTQITTREKKRFKHEEEDFQFSKIKPSL